MKPYHGFADMIRRRRKELGMTLSEVAAKMAWSIPYVSELERGVKQPPPIEQIRRLAIALQLNPFNLVKEAELSRRSVEIDLEGVSLMHRRLATLLARSFDKGLSVEEAEELVRHLERFGGDEEDDIH